MAEGFSNREIKEALAALNIPSSERSISRARKRWELGSNKPTKPDPARFDLRGDEADITGRATSELNSAEDLMEARGLDPEEWDIISMTVNEWDGPLKGGGTQPLRQLKLHLRRKVPIELISPPRTDGPVYKVPKARKKTEPRKVVFVGDQQAPYHSEELHDAFCDFLYEWEPDEGVLIGDTIDFPDISRHPAKPEVHVEPQECVDSGYDILRNYREAREGVIWKKLAGNHDERLRRYQIDKAEKIFGLRRAKVPGELEELPVLDVGHLMRLDELGIEYIRPQCDYEFEQIKVSPYLAACHGWIARKGSGASALATLQQLGYSVVHGHTHRQSIVHQTRHDIDGLTTVLVACETGCMCNIDGLGYAKAPDWQNGFATAEVFPDGTFHIDLATFVNGTLYHRGMKY
jgi:hypothetical protein